MNIHEQSLYHNRKKVQLLESAANTTIRTTAITSIGRIAIIHIAGPMHQLQQLLYSLRAPKLSLSSNFL